MKQPRVEARLRFVNESWRGAESLARIGSSAEQAVNTSYQRVEITSVRPQQEQGLLDLEVNGFTLTEHRTAVRDFSNPAEVETTYYDEVGPLVKRLTGASVVLPLQYVVRDENSTGFDATYVRFVHMDYGGAICAEFRRALFQECGLRVGEGADRCDVAFYNTWQPIDHVVERDPLAWIDANSLLEEDLSEYLIDGAPGMVPFYRPGQRIFYCPRMRPDELLLFKQMDTRPGVRPGCPHASFVDETSPRDVRPRRNVDVRWVAVHGPAGLCTGVDQGALDRTKHVLARPAGRGEACLENLSASQRRFVEDGR